MHKQFAQKCLPLPGSFAHEMAKFMAIDGRSEVHKTRRPEDSETRLPGCRKNQICDADLTQMIPINHNNVEPRNGSCIPAIEGLARAMVSRFEFEFAQGVALFRLILSRFD